MPIRPHYVPSRLTRFTYKDELYRPISLTDNFSYEYINSHLAKYHIIWNHENVEISVSDDLISYSDVDEITENIANLL